MEKLKKSKILLVSSVLSGLLLAGCLNGATCNGGTGGKLKAEAVIKVSNDGKTVEINYTNNTDEEQRFGPIFVDDTVVEEINGKFKLYDLDKGTPYSSGIGFPSASVPK